MPPDPDARNGTLPPGQAASLPVICARSTPAFSCLNGRYATTAQRVHQRNPICQQSLSASISLTFLDSYPVPCDF
jgi:hypothetical protein